MLVVHIKTALKLIITLGLIGCFVGHVWEQVDKHFSGRMMTLEEINHIDSVLLPSITICSKQPYKSRGHFFNRSSFEENAYTYEDLFHPSNVDIIQEWGLRMKEVMSQPWGRCFTFETDRMFIARESITLALAKDIEGVVAYVHDRGEEFWLTGDVFPYEVKTQGIKESSECSVRREDFINMHAPRLDKHCSSWDMSAFLKCTNTEYLRAIKGEDFKCHTIWWKELFLDRVPECTFDDMNEVERIGKWVEGGSSFPVQFAAKSHLFGCPFPCTLARFKMDCKGTTMNNHFSAMRATNDDEQPVYVWFFFLLTVVEQEEEIYLYDFIAIVAGVGGSLGLFLGFSCLQASFTIVDAIFDNCVWKKHSSETKVLGIKQQFPRP